MEVCHGSNTDQANNSNCSHTKLQKENEVRGNDAHKCSNENRKLDEGLPLYKCHGNLLYKLKKTNKYQPALCHTFSSKARFRVLLCYPFATITFGASSSWTPFMAAEIPKKSSRTDGSLRKTKTTKTGIAANITLATVNWPCSLYKIASSTPASTYELRQGPDKRMDFGFDFTFTS